MPSLSTSAIDRMAASTRWVEQHSGQSRAGRSQGSDQGIPFPHFVKLTEALTKDSYADAVVRVRNEADDDYEDGTEHQDVYPADYMADDDELAVNTICWVVFSCDPRHPHWVAVNWVCVTEEE